MFNGLNTQINSTLFLAEILLNSSNTEKAELYYIHMFVNLRLMTHY